MSAYLRKNKLKQLFIAPSTKCWAHRELRANWADCLDVCSKMFSKKEGRFSRPEQEDHYLSEGMH